jgi:hypothetical protein
LEIIFEECVEDNVRSQWRCVCSGFVSHDVDEVRAWQITLVCAVLRKMCKLVFERVLTAEGFVRKSGQRS